MKAVILAAGETKSDEYHGFPEKAKPKCLYNHGNEVALEETVKQLRKHGINEIIVIVRYNAFQIKEFAEGKGLELKFLYSTDSSDGGFMDSVIVGIRDIPLNEYFLLLLGDVVLSDDTLEKILESKSQFCLRVNHRRDQQGNTIDYPEFFGGKLLRGALGELNQLKQWVLEEAPRTPKKVLLSFTKWLCDHGAEEVQGKYWELDTTIDLESKWERTLID